LIDLGRDLKDVKVIVEGISQVEKVIDGVPAELRSGLEIDVASARRKLHELESKSSVFDQIDSDQLSIAKGMFNALKKRENTFAGPMRERFCLNLAIAFRIWAAFMKQLDYMNTLFKSHLTIRLLP